MAGPSESQPQVEVHAVVVAYRSAETLRGCVEPLAAMDGVSVTVVDNASPDESAAVVEDLPIQLIRAPRNGGFSYGCNLGSAGAVAPYLLFLNPDARLDAVALEAMIAVLRDDPRVGLVGPRILDDDGSLSWSLRRYPRLRSTYAQALFLHRLFPRAAWTDELIRDESAYSAPREAEWVSGACMLVRRCAYEQIGGFDEGFFLYCEDTDICKRLWDSDHTVRFEPRAEVHHVGGASSGAGETQAIAARSRVLYARKHLSRRRARLEAWGVALSEATHVVSSLGRPASRRGHAAALRAALNS
ncbi:MAG TPA: glycosyltransferase family 2 protein [Solirubrobacteraceae bacterium]|nr:glycosyltransferase family 2 protein [Solirubrobacteraceae bacterium]